MSAIHPYLSQLLEECPVRTLGPDDRYVIISDLHLGDGGRNDDFTRNGRLFCELLREWYLPRGYFIILNGDIEELLRAKRSSIIAAWEEIYSLFEEFRALGRLIWLRGNHEMPLNEDFLHIPMSLGDTLDPSDPRTKEHGFDGEAIKLIWRGRPLFIFHGHQAAVLNSGKYNKWVGLFLRIFANLFGFGNYSVAQDSEKKIRIEKTVYDFSKKQGILSLIGHTHRPLFESLSKHEMLSFQIERLCREYARRDDPSAEDIRRSILYYRDEYLAQKSQPRRHLADTVYGDILIPCLFNSGCGIGKRGITTIEIKQDRMYLIFWTDRARLNAVDLVGGVRGPMGVGKNAIRVILRRENLSYIFSRIELLR